jgi:hypothetical protein
MVSVRLLGTAQAKNREQRRIKGSTIPFGTIAVFLIK